MKPMDENEISTEINYQSLGHKKILLAEDIAFNQYIARHMLESWGFEVIVANNGIEVLELLRKDHFDCILMDIQMPEMDGLEAVSRIRKLPDALKASIPVIALTANALNGDSEKYISAGMTDYLPKPFEESKLFKMISKYLSSEQDSLSTSGDENPKPGVVSDKLYDLSMVRSVSGGDESFIKKMVALFIETVPPNVHELSKATKNEDWEQVMKMAHKLKSTVDSMGIKSLKTDIRTVEANAKQKEFLQVIPALVHKIESVINDCIGQLQSEFSQ